MFKKAFIVTFIVTLLGQFLANIANADAERFRLAVTTSFHNSGLADILVPTLERDLDLKIDLLVVGTGQALALGRNGDVDALLIHAKRDEEKFVADGFAPHRKKVMYNDFVFVGPKDDPAHIAKAATARQVLQKLHNSQSLFISRGDESGTHKKEKGLWVQAGMDPDKFDASWYRSSGSGMGATLNMASAVNGYLLTDRASWLNFKNKGDLALLFSGDTALYNQYAYLPLNKEKFPHTKRQLAEKIENWLISDTAKQLINDYKINGEQLFFFNGH